MKKFMQVGRAAVLALLAVSLSAVDAAIPSCWVSYYSKLFSNKIYLYNTGSRQLRTLYNSGDLAVSHTAFSPDGRQLAFIRKPDDGGSGTIMVINNDGTGARVVCNSFTSNVMPLGGTANIHWNQMGLFWVENNRNIYWADPVSGERKTLGTLQTNTKAEMLTMSLDGTRAYLHINHDVSPDRGGLFFGVTANAGGIVNERVFPEGNWDHGGTMLVDGSGALFAVWACWTIGYPSGCTNDHTHFGIFSYDNMNQYTAFRAPGGGVICGPDEGPCAAPNNPDLIVFGVGDIWTKNFRIFSLSTKEYVGFSPSLSDDYYYVGSFWSGDLPNPDGTGIQAVRCETGAVRAAAAGAWNLQGRALGARDADSRLSPGVAVVAGAGNRKASFAVMPVTSAAAAR